MESGVRTAADGAYVPYIIRHYVHTQYSKYVAVRHALYLHAFDSALVHTSSYVDLYTIHDAYVCTPRTAWNADSIDAYACAAG